MKNLLTHILSLTIISLLTFSVLTKVTLALNVPTVPNVPDKPHVPTVPNVPDKPHVPTLPDGQVQPTSTPQPGVSPTAGPGGVITTPTTTPQPGVGGPSEEAKEEEAGKPGEVLGLAAASSDPTGELIVMVIGLIISSFGFRKLLARS